MLKLTELLKGFPTSDDVPPMEITGIAVDSRQVKPGDLFFAVVHGVDRYKFLDQVVERGAAAVIGERSGIELSIPHVQVADTREALAQVSAAFYGQPARELTMIGITGTDGKTTTSNFVYYILQAAGHPTGMISTVNAQIGMQMMVVLFIVLIIGGLGSIGGCFVGALLVGLLANYTGYLAPKLALGSNILLMVLVLLWRPRGLFPIGKA